MLRFELDKLSLALLYDLQKKGRLNLQPEWQRSKVWNDRMKYDLIDTALRDWPMGLVMINVVDRVDATGMEIEHYEIVDGQQRISTLFDYRDGSADWTRKAPRNNPDFVPYSVLEPARQEHFDEYKVAVALMREYEEEEILDVYSRLQNSKPLQLGEKVKAFRTDFKPMLSDLTGHKIFRIASGRHRVRDAHWNLSAQFFKSVYRGTPLDRQEFENLQQFYRKGRGRFDEDRALRAQKQTSALLNLTNKIIEEAVQLDSSFEKTLQSARPLKWLFAGVYILKERYAISGKEHLLAKGLVEFHIAKDREDTDEWKAYVNTGRTGRVDTDDVRQSLEQMMNRMIVAAEAEPLDPQRFFTPEQRQEIFKRARGECEDCEITLSKTNFHADHKNPYRHGGPTTIENGQALCTACNRKKGGSPELFDPSAKAAAR